MQARIHTIAGIALAVAVSTASAQVTFYAQEGFRGKAFTTDRPVNNLERHGFNDAASSAVVSKGSWEVCTDEGFGGECRVLKKGSYESLRGMGLGNRISSVRQVKGGGKIVYAPQPLAAPTYAYRERPNEQLYQAQVTSAQAVFGAPEQRCWVEREQVQSQSNVNVPGAIIGGILGGVLGHQVGGGRGKDVATGLGAVGGAVVGSNVGTGGGNNAYTTRDVQKCAAAPVSATPAYWDVSYVFRGQPHRVQLSTSPGNTITVNANGEPRG